MLTTCQSLKCGSGELVGAILLRWFHLSPATWVLEGIIYIQKLVYTILYVKFLQFIMKILCINVYTGCNSKLNSYNRYYSINVSTGCNSKLNSYNRYHSINVSTGCNSKLNSYNRYHSIMCQLVVIRS